MTVLHLFIAYYLMTKKEMLDKIYQVIANKKPWFGCRVLTHHKWENFNWETYDNHCPWYISCLESDKEDGRCLTHYCGFWGQTKNGKYKTTIVWYPVMIWDVLERNAKRIDKYFPMLLKVLWLTTNSYYRQIGWNQEDKVDDFEEKVWKWISELDRTGDYLYIDEYNLYEKIKDKRLYKDKPIDKQPKECIQFIYNLIP